MRNEWLSVHLFHAGAHNKLLQLLIAPVVRQVACPYFFIRYREGGPHIRLRLYVRHDQQAAVRQLLEAAATAYFAAYPSFRQDSMYSSRGLQPNDSWQYIPYVPEISRYGNEDTMSLAEAQFGLSSTYVLEVIQQMSVSNTLLHAIKINLALLQALREPPLQTLDICRQFVLSWLPRLYDPQQDRQEQEAYYLQLLQERFLAYAPTLTQAAVNLWEELLHENAPAALQIFAKGNHHIFNQYRQLGIRDGRLGAITRSFLHMGHNRLGVSNHDEAYIMYFTGKCLEHIYGIPG
ncbi:thiopeptide-type bacteriocin biosynthesis protein [Chitinophaga qingshengii]|uniref:Thiopeptide-type bacteriocin biosynthesis domain-containing protein n=1 Tax=Chitinophaga qingshengii TaxID=1569794 RepID=A0ABR7TR28_9BACT|nr:thiopeptide-type bacteriocin biosynthesis protein [Chitinophaga qingshengii]MBC9932022.1 hypothetical protein [Chitinophaga qingshengii]